MEQSTLILWTFSAGLISALATGLGAIPVHFMQGQSKMVKAFSVAFAAGMMISASVFSLIQEGIALKEEFPLAPYIVMVGLLLGAVFLWKTEKEVDDHGPSGNVLTDGLTKKGFLIFMAMFIHSIPEGIAIGVAFATGDLGFGLIMAIAIAVHNIPEGIAVSLPLKSEGVSTLRCAFLSVMTSIPQPIMAVPAALLTWFFKPLLPIGLGFAGGAMIYLVVTQLLPDAFKEGGKVLTAWGVMVGLVGMLLLTQLLSLMPMG
ncbi:MAG: ZIP family metal transporter [Candidatus Omnitrophica bacterium]|nr:ZIP family metal transporter [Candidatus Omnitrophota bacterium]